MKVTCPGCKKTFSTRYASRHTSACPEWKGQPLPDFKAANDPRYTACEHCAALGWAVTCRYPAQHSVIVHRTWPR